MRPGNLSKSCWANNMYRGRNRLSSTQSRLNSQEQCQQGAFSPQTGQSQCANITRIFRQRGTAEAQYPCQGAYQPSSGQGECLLASPETTDSEASVNRSPVILVTTNLWLAKPHAYRQIRNYSLMVQPRNLPAHQVHTSQTQEMVSVLTLNPDTT